MTISNSLNTTETINACGSYTWHGTTYTSSNNTATWTGISAAGCDSVVTLNLTISNTPSQPGNFTSKTTFVYKGQNAVTYTIPAVSGATSYNWSYSGTGAQINGTGNSVTIDYSLSATSGTLSVTAANTCGASTSRTLSIYTNDTIALPTTNLDYSFVTVGCNRVDYLDTAYSTNDPDYSAGASTANVYQLKRLFTEISKLNPLPKFLIMTGDIVMGYKTPSTPDTIELAKQLTSWRQIYENHPLSSMGIQLIAVPGNHETQDKAAGKKSFLSAEKIFARVMAPYILGSNGPSIGGPDSLTTDQSKLTYSFDYHGDHFVMINTDPVGKDNTTPYKWIGSDLQTARANNVRNIFAFGHKPAYSSSLTPNGGLDAVSTMAQRDSLWKYFENNNTAAMFTAHEHLWDTIHPHAGKTWQVIAGNGGTRVEPVWVGAGQKYYGYTIVNVYNDRKINVMGVGRNTDQNPTAGATPYAVNEDLYPSTVRNSFNICLTTTTTETINACGSYTWHGNTYTSSNNTATWTGINAAGCDSIVTLNLTINAVPNQPDNFTSSSSSVNSGQSNVTYAVPNIAGVTYNWSYSGSGATINGSGNSIAVSFASTATSGTLSVTASNSCTSLPRTINITVTPPLDINLCNYVRVGRYDLPEPTRTTAPTNSLLAQEASTVTYNWDTQTLFVVGDGGTSVVQVSKTGQLINSMTLAPGNSPQGTDFYDPEGITYIGNGKFVMTEERDRNVVEFTYVAGGTLTRANAKTVTLGTFVQNIGLEGVSYDPLTGGFILVKETQPQGIFQTNIDFNAGTATNGSATTINSTNLFDPALANLLDFADVYALSNIPSLSGQAMANNLLVLSQESGKIVNISRSGVISSSLTIQSDAGNPLSIAAQQH